MCTRLSVLLAKAVPHLLRLLINYSRQTLCLAKGFPAFLGTLSRLKVQTLTELKMHVGDEHIRKQRLKSQTSFWIQDNQRDIFA